MFQGCPIWATWLVWTKCTVSCGGGIRTRERLCVGGKIGDIGCDNNFVQQEPCGGEVSNSIISNIIYYTMMNRNNVMYFVVRFIFLI